MHIRSAYDLRLLITGSWVRIPPGSPSKTISERNDVNGNGKCTGPTVGPGKQALHGLIRISDKAVGCPECGIPILATSAPYRATRTQHTTANGTTCRSRVGGMLRH